MTHLDLGKAQKRKGLDLFCGSPPRIKISNPSPWRTPCHLSVSSITPHPSGFGSDERRESRKKPSGNLSRLASLSPASELLLLTSDPFTNFCRLLIWSQEILFRTPRLNSGTSTADRFKSDLLHLQLEGISYGFFLRTHGL